MLTCECKALELAFKGVKLTAQHATSKRINLLQAVRMNEDSGSTITIVS
jgi:hypothetical protein